MDQDPTTPENYPYQMNQKNRILGSGMTGQMAPSKRALPADAVGSLDWQMVRLFGDREKALDMLESFLYDQECNPLIYQFCATYRQWEKDFQDGTLDEPPNLNQVAFRLKVNTNEIFDLVTEGTKRLAGRMSTIRASQLSPQVIEAAGQFALDPDGYKDRELILKVSGVIQDQKGINITNNNQVGVKVETNIKIPEAVSKRFQETIHEIDESVREDVFTKSD